MFCAGREHAVGNGTNARTVKKGAHIMGWKGDGTWHPTIKSCNNSAQIQPRISEIHCAIVARIMLNLDF